MSRDIHDRCPATSLPFCLGWWATEAQWAGEFYYLLIVHYSEAPVAVINEALAVANSFVPI